jgi:hypothetical protein
MGTVFRFTATLGVAALLLSIAVWSPQAQQDNANENDRNDSKAVKYDFTGLLTDYDSTTVEVPARGFGWHPEPDSDAPHPWAPFGERGEGAMFETIDDVCDILETLFMGLEYDTRGDIVRIIQDSSSSITVHAPDSVHRIVEQLLEAVHDVADARVSFEVYRAGPIPEDRVTATLTAADAARAQRDGRIVGAVSGSLGDSLLLEHVQTRKYVAEYSANVAESAFVATPMVDTLRTGESFRFGALLQPDGQIWVNAWYMTQQLQQIIEAEVEAGKLELPQVDFAFTPVSAVIENGGAVVIDMGEGNRYVIRVTCDMALDHRVLKVNDTTNLHLLNCINKLTPASLTGRWMLQDGGDCGACTIPAPWWPDTVNAYSEAAMHDDFSWYLEELLDSRKPKSVPFGPWRALIIHDSEEEILRAVKDRLTPRQSIEVQVNAFTMSKGDEFLEGVRQGRPSADEIAKLPSSARFSRCVSTLPYQVLDVVDAQHQAVIAGYDSSVARNASVVVPVIEMLSSGHQMRYRASHLPNERAEIVVRLAMADGPKEIEWFDASPGMTVTRSERAIVDTRIAARLKVGEYASTIVPCNEDEDSVVVVTVQRTR